MKLDPKKIPVALHPALSFAEQWGIGDDYEREDAIGRASQKQLESIAHSLDNVDDTALVGWLTGPAAKDEHLSQEYLAFTNLTMAVQSAKVKLKRMTSDKHNSGSAF